MMAVAQLFEEFGRDPIPEVEVKPLEVEDVEDLKLKAFEEGYGAGWDDAVTAQVQSGKYVSDALKQNLAALSVTREDVLLSFMQASESLFKEIAAKVLPEVANRVLVDHVVSVLTNAVRQATDQDVSITVAPSEVASVTSRLESEGSDQIEVHGNPQLSPGQAELKLGRIEKQIDLPAMISEISAAIDAFHKSVEEGNSHV
ncbi:hypothetical protein E4Z66_17725 [Aliishimia ponticola]|uniref:Flagellar biosynthesis protein n=1 Tax=Aliishimia ponticola TaxID=2499833 RepID=A0A4S4N6N8_9RHOB|nr:hypothetical protein [Aliishimia ponticola]THH34802.1 hypothetical protein E4Z66_17725 [Aliishimia ponticola]